MGLHLILVLVLVPFVQILFLRQQSKYFLLERKLAFRLFLDSKCFLHYSHQKDGMVALDLYPRKWSTHIALHQLLILRSILQFIFNFCSHTSSFKVTSRPNFETSTDIKVWATSDEQGHCCSYRSSCIQFRNAVSILVPGKSYINFSFLQIFWIYFKLATGTE